jgi:hypothetical protein
MIPPVASHQSTPARVARRTLFLGRQADTGRSGGEMSHQLPPRLNIEFLKKQAKETDDVLQRVSAAASLGPRE